MISKDTTQHDGMKSIYIIIIFYTLLINLILKFHLILMLRFLCIKTNLSFILRGNKKKCKRNNFVPIILHIWSLYLPIELINSGSHINMSHMNKFRASTRFSYIYTCCVPLYTYTMYLTVVPTYLILRLLSVLCYNFYHKLMISHLSKRFTVNKLVTICLHSLTIHIKNADF